MSTSQAPYARSLAQVAGTVLNIFDFTADGSPVGVTDWWTPIRTAIQFLKESGGGKLIFPVWRYRVAYDGDDAERTSSTGVIDLSPWEDSASPSSWHATENIEIRFENGAVLWMDNLVPVESSLIGESLLGEELFASYTANAQTHAIYARCRWTDVDGAHTPTAWSGHAVNYGAIKLVNVCVEWTRPAARGTGDSFHFAGTKSRDTAPYDIVLENCSAYNAPQVGAILIGCRDSKVSKFHSERCWADGVHFNACFEGCSSTDAVNVDGGDDAVAAVTYYPDVITLARGLDTEIGPLTSPDQETANNNGLIISGVQKVGGRANGVRLLGANRVKVTGVSVDAKNSGEVGAAVWVGAVKANGTTLAESGLAALGCEVSKISVKGGAQVGLHIVCLGMDGDETDAWLRNDVLVRGVHATECVQVSIYGQATKGFRIDGAKTDDSAKCDFSACSDYSLDHFECGAELVLTGEANSYAELDMDTLPWHNIHLGTIKVRGNRMLVTDVRGLIANSITVIDSPASSFEGIRLADFYCPNMRIIRGNREATVDLAHIPLRCIPGRRWNLDVQIDHDDGDTQNLIEVGGGDAFNIGRDIRINGIVIHEVAGLGADPWEIQGGGFAPVNFYRKSRCRAEGTWGYVNTDDLPLGIVPEITAAEVSGVRTLKVFDALALYATGVLNTLATALSTAAVYAARCVRFLQSPGDEGSAGVIDYRQLQADALSIHGAGTSGTNRLVRVYDNMNVNGDVTAASTVQGANLIATDTTGNQPARFDALNRLKGGKTALTDANDVTLGSIAEGAILVRESNRVGGLTAMAGNRNMVTDADGKPAVQGALTPSRVMYTAGDGLPTTVEYASLAAALLSHLLDLGVINDTAMTAYAYSKDDVNTLLSGYSLVGHNHDGSYSPIGHNHGGTTGETSGHSHSISS